MREPPSDFDASALLDLVRHQWDEEVDSLEHLPVGFGAHHWAASDSEQRRLFVTVDHPLERRSGAMLEDAYAAAAALRESGLEFVLACLPSRNGPFTVPLGEDSVSVTPWLDGVSGSGPLADDAEARETAALLGRLHRAAPPPALHRWRPLVQPRLPDDLAIRTSSPWREGPFGEEARAAVVGRLPQIERWTREYVDLAARALDARSSWVTTHGEPHSRNHLLTGSGRLLVDWESVLLAPAERDLDGLVSSGSAWRASYSGPDPEPAMLRLFDLEWRLSEIDGFSHWLAAGHTGNESDAVALGGLLEELRRPDRS